MPGDAWYAEPVQWAVDKGITGGTGADTFSPHAPCTRGQVVMFLWRAADSPVAAERENRFTDVTEADYFYEAVLWAVEQGITGGIGDGRFGPDAPCTRAQVATFLWRAQGSPAVTDTNNPFSDVTDGDYFFTPVLWAVENQITGGIGDGQFGAAQTCTRSQIVTFLWKTYEEDGDTPAPTPTPDHGHEHDEPIRLIQSDPELFLGWQELVDKYYFMTHVEIGVISPGSGIYHSTLQAEMAAENPPALFVVSGAQGLKQWRDSCYNLRGTEFCEGLISPAFTLTEKDKVLGVAADLESYGLLVNVELLNKAGFAVEDVRGFEELRIIAEDITARTEELGCGAFAPVGDTSLLANLPIYYETVRDGRTIIMGRYLPQLRSLWELMAGNSTCDPAADGLQAFLNGEAVFCVGGTWDYEAVSAVYGENEAAMVPLYFGVDDAAQGLCTGSETYWCVNAKAEPEKVEGILKFLNWAVSDSVAAAVLQREMGYDTPFGNAKTSDNLFARQARAAMESGKEPVTFCFERMPDGTWKEELHKALLDYAAEQTDENWTKVTDVFLRAS